MPQLFKHHDEIPPPKCEPNMFCHNVPPQLKVKNVSPERYFSSGHKFGTRLYIWQANNFILKLINISVILLQFVFI